MYIISMKFIFPILLLSLLGCVGSKPVVEWVAGDSPKCGELTKLHTELQESAKEWVKNVKNYKQPNRAYCIETITCNKVAYCVVAYSPPIDISPGDTIDILSISVYKGNNYP